MVYPRRLELLTVQFATEYSIQLSYGYIFIQYVYFLQKSRKNINNQIKH